MLTRFKIFVFSFVLFILAAFISAENSYAATHSTKKTTIHKNPAKKTKSKAKKKKKISAPPAIPQNVSIQEGIDRILSNYSRLNVGVIAQSTANGATLYRYNDTRTFMPASTLKLFTGVAGLTYLGPDFIFKTQVLTDGTVDQSGKLNGNLYVKFTGDPELTVPYLDNLLNVLPKQGIKQINGHLIIDDFAMDHSNMAPGWLWKEQLLCYAAPSNAVIVNRNCFGFSIAPGKPGQPARVSAEPNWAHLVIINQTVTRGGRAACTPLEIKPTGSNTFTLTGCVSRRGTISVGVPLNDTRLAGANIVKNLLNQDGIPVAGSILYQPTPSNARLLAQRCSRSLDELVTKMLKKSDNIIANTIFKKLGEIYFHTTGTWQNGTQAVRAILGPKTGIDFSKIVIMDGSGLSRFDQVSPDQFAKLLNYAYRMPNNQIFFAALPRSSVDGTLKGRLGGPTVDKVHAKTGTMDSISGLAGYIQSANHGNITFAILVNDPRGGKGQQGVYHSLQDRICQFLAVNRAGISAPKPVITPSVPAANPTASTNSAPGKTNPVMKPQSTAAQPQLPTEKSSADESIPSAINPVSLSLDANLFG